MVWLEIAHNAGDIGCDYIKNTVLIGIAVLSMLPPYPNPEVTLWTLMLLSGS